MSLPEPQPTVGARRLLLNVAVAASATLALLGAAAFYYAARHAHHAQADAGEVLVKVLANGCEPNALRVPAGSVRFRILNQSDRAVEWEILDGVMVVEERENIAPGMTQALSAYLNPGDYQITCGLLSNPRGSLHVDASAAALAVAQCNAQQLRLPVVFFLGSWFAPLAQQQFDLIVSNPPYIAAADPHLQALRHEPLAALASGADGLDDIRHIIAQAPAHLRAGGHLLLEHGFDQGQAVAQLLAQAGFVQIEQRQDLSGHIRCTGGKITAVRR